MFVELHILQNFAPSNLNRDDTGSPKDCEFGGYRRARISSQCFKRAVRLTFEDGLLQSGVGRRSKRQLPVVIDHLVARGRTREDAQGVAMAAFGGIGVLFESAGDEDEEEVKSEYLVFAGPREMERFAAVCDDNWDYLSEAFRKAWPDGAKKKPKKDAARSAVTKVRSALIKTLDGGHAADLALFGRMLADLPEKNIDAASQVAHAISTNRVSMEMDYYTAVDDLKPEDSAGADMIGTVGFNSACFYRYSNVDVGQLERNLQGDEELTRKSLEAYIRGSVSAIPTGKQNSMAAHNPPSFIFTVVRESSQWNLANSFLTPVTPSRDADLASRSIKALDSYWGKLVRMYGASAVTGKWTVSLEEDSVDNLKDSLVPSLDDLVGNVLTATVPGQANGR